MRRIDVFIIGIAVFAIGGAGYLGLQLAGLDDINAGIWSQLILVAIILGWSSTYIFRVANKNMTYDQQRKEYEDAVLQKRYDDLTPQELAQLQAEIEQDRQKDKGNSI
ncbi:MAG: DUF3007 family protein [Chamaesiphon sp.]|nr:DUF3007 family protein [Chamaesiphon sp.]